MRLGLEKEKKKSPSKLQPDLLGSGFSQQLPQHYLLDASLAVMELPELPLLYHIVTADRDPFFRTPFLEEARLIMRNV